MGKSLIIKNADFSENAVDVVKTIQITNDNKSQWKDEAISMYGMNKITIVASGIVTDKSQGNFSWCSATPSKTEIFNAGDTTSYGTPLFVLYKDDDIERASGEYTLSDSITYPYLVFRFKGVGNVQFDVAMS